MRSAWLIHPSGATAYAASAPFVSAVLQHLAIFPCGMNEDHPDAMARHHLRAADRICRSCGCFHRRASLARRWLPLPTAILRGSVCAEASVLRCCCLDRHCRRSFHPWSKQKTELCCIDSSRPPLPFQPCAAVYLAAATASSELVAPVCRRHRSG